MPDRHETEHKSFARAEETRDFPHGKAEGASNHAKEA